MWIEYEIKCANGHKYKGCVNSDKLKWFGFREKFKFHIEYDDDTDDWFYFDYEEDVELVIEAFKKAIMGNCGTIKDIGYIRPFRHPFFNDETTLSPSAYQGEPI